MVRVVANIHAVIQQHHAEKASEVARSTCVRDQLPEESAICCTMDLKERFVRRTQHRLIGNQRSQPDPVTGRDWSRPADSPACRVEGREVLTKGEGRSACRSHRRATAPMPSEVRGSGLPCAPTSPSCLPIEQNSALPVGAVWAVVAPAGTDVHASPVGPKEIESYLPRPTQPTRQKHPWDDSLETVRDPSLGAVLPIQRRNAASGAGRQIRPDVVDGHDPPAGHQTHVERVVGGQGLVGSIVLPEQAAILSAQGVDPACRGGGIDDVTVGREAVWGDDVVAFHHEAPALAAIESVESTDHTSVSLGVGRFEDQEGSDRPRRTGHGAPPSLTDAWGRAARACCHEARATRYLEDRQYSPPPRTKLCRARRGTGTVRCIVKRPQTA